MTRMPHKAVKHALEKLGQPWSIEPGLNLDDLTTIIGDPYVMKALGGCPDIRMDGSTLYLSAYIGDKFVGCFAIIRSTPLNWEVHSFLMRRALRYSRELARLAIDWVFAHAPITRVTAFVRDDMPSASNFALKLGFVHEGTMRDACRSGDRLIGMKMMGLTREDARCQSDT